MYSKKIDLDKFYTKESIAIDCIKQIKLDDYDLVIEPSAGSGSFFNNIVHDNKVGLDILPEAEGIIKQNWFDYKIDKKFKNVLVIGNPPFGKRNKLSIEFIKKSMDNNVNTVAFILPNVFNKYTLQKKINSNYRLVSVTSLPDNSFTLSGESYNVPCSFFVFDKQDGPCLRFDPSLYVDTIDWEFSNKGDFDFFIFGASPKKIVDFPNENNRGYYIKLKNPKDKDKVISNFKDKITWKGHSSASGGVSWLTRPEIVKLYNEMI